MLVHAVPLPMLSFDPGANVLIHFVASEAALSILIVHCVQHNLQPRSCDPIKTSNNTPSAASRQSKLSSSNLEASSTNMKLSFNQEPMHMPTALSPHCCKLEAQPLSQSSLMAGPRGVPEGIRPCCCKLEH